jgi:hypothetical protein
VAAEEGGAEDDEAEAESVDCEESAPIPFGFPPRLFWPCSPCTEELEAVEAATEGAAEEVELVGRGGDGGCVLVETLGGVGTIPFAASDAQVGAPFPVGLSLAPLLFSPPPLPAAVGATLGLEAAAADAEDDEVADWDGFCCCCCCDFEAVFE